MKKLLTLAVLLAFMLALAPAALAAGGNASKANGATKRARNVKYSLNGVVTAVDAENGTVSVLAKRTNRRARAYRGDVVTLTVTDATRLLRRTVDGDLVTVTLADIVAGDRVTSVGKLDKSDPASPVFTAFRITLRPALGTGTNCGS